MDSPSEPRILADPRRYGVAGLVLLVVGMALMLASKPAFVIAGTAILVTALLLLFVSWLRIRKINSGVSDGSR